MGQVRDTKKAETRQRISDVATELFFERGFDAVTVDEIAVAAKVAKMTVFNYFSRKEELILDREDDLKLLPFREALQRRPEGQSAADALRGLISAMSEQKHPLCHVTGPAIRWWRVVEASPALRARLRELADEASEELARVLGGASPDGLTRLAASLIVQSVRTAREEAVRLAKRGASMKKANGAFLELMEQGLAAVDHVLKASQTRQDWPSSQGALS